MVLAAMLEESVKRKAREEGFAEGLRKGREKGIKKEREEYRKRWDEACARFGFEVDGVLVLPWTPEVERFLWSEPKE